MVRSSKGHKRRTRHRLKRELREKFTVEPVIKEFKLGDKVIIKISPSARTFPHPIYLGLAGHVSGVRGRSYIVSVRKGRKEKSLIVRPENLRRG